MVGVGGRSGMAGSREGGVMGDVCLARAERASHKSARAGTREQSLFAGSTELVGRASGQEMPIRGKRGLGAAEMHARPAAPRSPDVTEA